MKKIFIGGVMVLLPVALLTAAFVWVFHFVTDLIRPLTTLVVDNLGLPELVGHLIVIAVILLVCFLIGGFVTTGLGRWVHNRFDRYLVKLAPGYRLIKATLEQFFGDPDSSPFASGEVAIVRLFGTDCPTSVTALVTSRHPNGDFTVFVPTGPNPTSGLMYHLKPDQVELHPEIKVEEMMRTIIACGAGTGKLFGKRSQEI